VAGVPDFHPRIVCALIRTVGSASVLALLTAALLVQPLSAGSAERIRVAPDSRSFVTPAGHPFRPWGFNYDRDHRMRLLEEYWETDWATVVEDFAEMKRLGANVVRIHLQVAAFLEDPVTPRARALRQLRRLLRLAERTGLRVDLTGLGCYRRAQSPRWYDRLNESDRWHAQAVFWRAVARVTADSPALFCYNLMNEPFVPGTARTAGDWLAGELGGFSYVQAITLDPAGRPRPEIARAWVRHLSRAIRQEDPAALITVGLLPETRPTGSFSGFDPAVMAEELDFLSVHLYPKPGQWQEARAVLRACTTGKPLVVEEIFPLPMSPAELATFVQEHRDWAAGWITFYWGQSAEELARGTTFQEQWTHDWLVRWQLLGLGHRPGP
jgi:hypothetical protein